MDEPRRRQTIEVLNLQDGHTVCLHL